MDTCLASSCRVADFVADIDRFAGSNLALLERSAQLACLAKKRRPAGELLNVFDVFTKNLSHVQLGVRAHDTGAHAAPTKFPQHPGNTWKQFNLAGILRRCLP